MCWMDVRWIERPCVVVCLALSLVPLGAAEAATLRVPSEYPAIQAAVDVAAAGDTVLVAPGSYLENVVIEQPAIVLLSETGAEVTTIDGQGLAPVVRVVQGADGVTIDGFRITGGSTHQWFEGGGITTNLWRYERVAIRNNIVEHNYSELGAGGIFTGGEASIENNLIQFNNNPVAGNYETSALHAAGLIGNNIVRRNGSLLWGIDDATAVVSGVVENNLFVENDAPAFEVIEVIAPATVRNNTIAKNYGEYGHPWFAVAIGGQDSYEFSRNIVAHGESDGLGCNLAAGAEKIVECNDVWGTGQSFVNACAGDEGINGNFSVDPLFCDLAGGDYRLRPESPCAPDNSPPGCGLIGARPVGCGAASAGPLAAAARRLRLTVRPNPVRWGAEFVLERRPGLPATLEIYDPTGRLVDVLAARGTVAWRPAAAARSGIYFARLRAGSRTEVVKFVVVH